MNGLVAPERRIRLRASGTIIGSSNVPGHLEGKRHRLAAGRRVDELRDSAQGKYALGKAHLPGEADAGRGRADAAVLDVDDAAADPGGEAGESRTACARRARRGPRSKAASPSAAGLPAG